MTDQQLAVLRSRVDTAHLPPLTRAVVERVILTTADPTWLGDLVLDEQALAAGRDALGAGGPLVVDVRMLAAAVAPRDAVIGLDMPGVAELAKAEGTTRSAAGIRLAARAFPDGAVWAVGNAPTALQEILRLAAAGSLRPALVIGIPVGFVGSVDAKAALRRSGLPAASSATERGGAAIAGSVVNALVDAWQADAHVR
ncbi:precorrin-8X methylmutase [Kutzneria buriramensis]|uniref:Precorrin-8X/cobalt-precorrin-8 methylmutase n=1 Tax=Kutzneria buriramensis TaxID=1045776 RepID=A0A3E0I0H1_9PSEU|nr:precorrin-8X methylmutase [Kutzneria buriramensis]REH52218.1 precorrin-8X/cobalt-precorrin-8 methylmutase [Kutzneria buriramensis]